MGDWRDGRGGLHWYALEQAGPNKTHHPREVGQPDWRDNVVTKIWTSRLSIKAGSPYQVTRASTAPFTVNWSSVHSRRPRKIRDRQVDKTDKVDQVTRIRARISWAEARDWRREPCRLSCIIAA